MNIIRPLIATAVMICTLWSCKKESSITPPPNPPPDTTSNQTEERTFPDVYKADSALLALYDRQMDFTSLNGDGVDPGWKTMTDFSESFPSENASVNIVQRTGWAFNSWALDWVKAYAYIKDLNRFIFKDSISTALPKNERNVYKAEAKFLRANIYFELVKRMGGVPLITEDTSKTERKDLKTARAKESEVYDFIIDQAELIKNVLPSDPNIKARASKGAALAMESRAALYAASMAKYGVTDPSVYLPGGEVGISASQASNYYTIAFTAANEIIGGQAGPYSLYQSSSGAASAADNFARLFTDKFNPESIYTEDIPLGGRPHNFTVDNQPFSLTEEANSGGRLNPSLTLAENFEKLDNTYAPLPTRDGAGNPIYYTNPKDIFEGRDGRLGGTFFLPGDKFKNGTLDIWAGYQLHDGTIITSDRADHLKPLTAGGTPVQVVGNDGPVSGLEFRTQTGFYLRKYIDPTLGAGRLIQGSPIAFIRYRYAEVLLNAAEAAFELGNSSTAAQYMSLVRARAGLVVPLTSGEVTFDRIVHERRVELAFEGHYLFDMKRWRLATTVWTGQPTLQADLKNNIGVARRKSTQPWGLFPYKIYDPGNPHDGKWIFKEMLPPLVTGFNLFVAGNYYSAIPQDVIAANPLIVQQPNQ